MSRKVIFSNWRINILKLFTILITALILLRLFYLQLFKHDQYQVLAEKQHWLQREIPAQRGDLLTADGFKLATNEEAYLVFAVPPEIEKKTETAQKLIEVLGWQNIIGATDAKGCPIDTTPEGLENGEGSKSGLVDLPQENLSSTTKRACPDNRESTRLVTQILSDQLGKSDRYWYPIAHKISISTRDQIESFKLPGIYFESEQKRIYPESTLATHVLGFVGKNEQGYDQGYFGLEGYYHGDLSGQSGLSSLERDALGKPIPVGGIQVIKPDDGRTLISTVNRELQYRLEQQLNEGVKKYGATDGTFILIQPQTGKVWALGNFPTFNPQSWNEYLKEETDVAKVDLFRNIAVSSSYEPGSVLKVVLMAAALDSQTVSPETIYNDTGPLSVDGHLIKTWNNKYHGEINIAQILQLSNNTGATHLALQLGFDKYWKYLQKFRLGKATGIDLEGEAIGIVKPPHEWRRIDLATAAFGQGIALTPLQLATIFQTIANDGVMMKPYVIQEIIDQEKTIPVKPTIISKPISVETAHLMQNMLQSVVDEGEFKWFVKKALLEKFAIAGKTGTAQIPINGRYDPQKTQVTFVGFIPVDDPKFVLLVKLSQPTTSTYSAETVVPLWLEMAKELIVYFGISPR